MPDLKKLQSLFRDGVNLIDYLKEEVGVNYNRQDVIELSYDIMAGSYNRYLNEGSLASEKDEYGQYIAEVINNLCKPEYILEAGIGEATTFAYVLKYLEAVPNSYGFDLSWSRLAYGRQLLEQFDHQANLFTADMYNIPCSDNSFDVVFTSHALEPNGGNEKAILSELLRVTAGWLVLLEPGYELASEEARNRMERLGYCKNLPKVITQLGCTVQHHSLIPNSINPLNPTALTIVKKGKQRQESFSYLCPVSKTRLKEYSDCYYSDTSLLAYPILSGIPCLKQSDSLIASHFSKFSRSSGI